MNVNTQNETKASSPDKNKPVKKSWALMALDEEEEDAREMAEEKQKNTQKLATIRRDLYSKGQYELEDGEIIE